LVVNTDFPYGDPASRYAKSVVRLSPSGGDATKAAEAQGIIEAAIKNYGRPDSRIVDCEWD
jgi:hypothetical protein